MSYGESFVGANLWFARIISSLAIETPPPVSASDGIFNNQLFWIAQIESTHESKRIVGRCKFIVDKNKLIAGLQHFISRDSWRTKHFLFEQIYIYMYMFTHIQCWCVYIYICTYIVYANSYRKVYIVPSTLIKVTREAQHHVSYYVNTERHPHTDTDTDTDTNMKINKDIKPPPPPSRLHTHVSAARSKLRVCMRIHIYINIYLCIFMYTCIIYDPV